MLHQVNSEMRELESALTAAATLIRPGGRLAVMSYHSLEDTRVKRLLRAGTFTKVTARNSRVTFIQADRISALHAVTGYQRDASLHVAPPRLQDTPPRDAYGNVLAPWKVRVRRAG